MQVFRLTLSDGSRKFHTALQAPDATAAETKAAYFLRYVGVADLDYHARWGCCRLATGRGQSKETAPVQAGCSEAVLSKAPDRRLGAWRPDAPKHPGTICPIL